MRHITGIVVGGVLAMAAGYANAAILSTWTFDNSSLAGTVSDINLVASDAGAVQGTQASNTITVAVATAYKISISGSTNPAIDPATTSYLAFSLTTSTGTFSLSNIKYDFTGDNNVKYALYYAINGSTTYTLLNNGSTGSSSSTPATVSSSLSATSVSSVDFRLYIGKGNNNGGVRAISFDNLIIEGTYASVPEPAGLGIAAVMAGGFLLRRRRA